ncbi:MAG: hypothetical protein WC816_04305 [Sphingomonas sp.]|jgi:hypothetical protein
MALKSAVDWLTWAAVVLPLVAIAWSAVQYVRTQRREQEYREFEKFHRIMSELGTQNTTVMGNMALAYELRKFPQYREVIVRALEDIDVRGSRADLLKREFSLTIELMKRQ